MQTHGLGRLFWHTIKLTDAPIVHRAKTSMINYPYYWARPLVIRFTSSRGVVIGWWRKHQNLDVTAHLASALSLCPVEAPDLPTEDRFYGADPARVP